MNTKGFRLAALAVGLVILSLAYDPQQAEAGVIKNIFQKITNTGNKTEETVKESAPICGSGIFSSPDERSLSPEIIFITSRPSRSTTINSNSPNHNSNNYNHDRESHHHGQGTDRNRRQAKERIDEVALEFRFHEENVTLSELERHGFNRDAPVTFLMHGFTSGYPLQAWISAIVESYTIDRQSAGSGSGSHSRQLVDHNLFIVNWNYAARGILYPRAVANIPIVASYVTRFINDKLLQEARINPQRIQLIGHSLGAHLSGFIGKNTDEKLGRIYGLDPAGPCFGSISGSLYPSSKRLAPGDAREVITIHTNSALLGIDKPLGRHSVFVEGGATQPGCKAGGGVLSSIGTLTWDGGDFDTLACSHSRAPNLLTYRHDQRDTQDDCQMVAYECKDWDSFLAGHCGVCDSGSSPSRRGSKRPEEAVECIRIGLDWQYPKSGGASHNDYNDNGNHNANHNADHNADHNGNHNSNHNHQSSSGGPTRRPSSSSYQDDDDERGTSRRPRGGNNSNRDHKFDRSKRWADKVEKKKQAETNETSSERSLLFGKKDQEESDVVKMFMRTGDTQPYCAYHYQVVLILNEPFEGRSKPPMSIILQDSETDRSSSSSSSSSSASSASSGRESRNQRRDRNRRADRGQPRRGQEQNSLSNDEFGNKFDDRTYTHLLTSNRKLSRIDHATLLFRNGLPEGKRILKDLRINYMSHIDPQVRQKLSSHLCLANTETDQQQSPALKGNRFYFEPCDGRNTNQAYQGHQDHQDHENQGQDYNGSHSTRRPSSTTSSYNNDDDHSSGGHSHNNNYNSNQSGSYNGSHQSGQSGHSSSSNHNGGGQHGNSSGGHSGGNYGSGSSNYTHNSNSNYGGGGTNYGNHNGASQNHGHSGGNQNTW